jgi:hypothetical protein
LPIGIVVRDSRSLRRDATEQADDNGAEHEAGLAIAQEIAQHQEQADTGSWCRLNWEDWPAASYGVSRSGSVRTTRKPILVDALSGVLELRAAADQTNGQYAPGCRVPLFKGPEDVRPLPPKE